MIIDTNELLSLSQAAEMMGTSTQRLFYYMKIGGLPYTEIGGHRFIRKDDTKFLRGRRAIKAEVNNEKA